MSPNIIFRGSRITYDRQGEGNTIVLLHGFIESRRIWDEFAASLAQELTVLTIDLPGHGESDVLADVHTMEMMAEIVSEVMTKEGINAGVIVGHSMGGYVALAFGQQYPEKVSGLVLFHSQAAPDTDEARTNRMRTIEIVRKDRAGFIRQFIPDLFDPRNVEALHPAIEELAEEASRMSKEGIIAAIEGMRLREGGLSYLGSTEKPILFIAGKQDKRIPVQVVVKQAEIPAHAELLSLDHVGHMGYLEAPEIILPAIRSFTRRCFKSS
jgi:pimeloyl-ACP methyl ester carboxylesterase